MTNLNLQPFRMSFMFRIVLICLIALGVVAFYLLSLENSTAASFHYLIGSLFFLGMGLCGLFFTAIQHITRAKWSTSLRRVMEAMALTLPVSALLFIGVLKGSHHTYEWSHESAVAHDVLLQWKEPFLNMTAFTWRMIAYFVIWIGSAFFLVRNSMKQDHSGDENLTVLNWKASALVLVLYALSVSAAGFDFLMSLEPHWFSTIFGVYFFAGLFQAGLAMIYLLTWIAHRSGALKDFVNLEHFHDIARFIFGFSIFWAYIGFSQYLLIWYGDLPEETFFYLVRMEPGWACLSIALLFIRFVTPFLVLMPYGFKRNYKVVLPIVLVIFAGQWLDLFWVAAPAMRLMEHGAGHHGPVIGWREISMGVGFVACFLLVVGHIMQAIRMVPVRDPRLEDSIHHHG